MSNSSRTRSDISSESARVVPALEGSGRSSLGRTSPSPGASPLGPLLAQLSDRQRVAVVLVHGFGWTLREVAELTNTKVTTVQNHLERGLAQLRRGLEVTQHE